MLTHLRLHQPKRYWLLQLLGWGFFVLVNMAVALSETGNTQKVLLIELVMVTLIGLGFTHLYRYVVHRMGWLGLGWVRIVLLIFISSLVMGTLLLASTLVVLYYAQHDMFLRMKANSLVLNYVNYMVLFVLWQVLYFGIHFFMNYKKAEIDKLRAEAQSKAFELTTLRSQINPHFIFNALTGIRMLVSENPAKAKDSISRLSKMLRRSLYFNEQPLVSLDEELAAVEDYLQLEQIRFEEKLNVTWNVQVPHQAQVLIPPMVLLTLVENSIKHGVSRQATPGYVRIQVLHTPAGLHLVVENNGHYTDKNNGNGFGLHYLHRRLQAAYPGGYTLNIGNTAPNAVRAEILLPL